MQLWTPYVTWYLSAPSPLTKNQLSIPIWMTLVLVILVFMYCVIILLVVLVFMYCVVSYHGNKKSSSSFNLTCILLCVLDFNTLLKSNRSFSFSTAKHYFMARVSFWINVLPFFSFVVMGLQDFIIHMVYRVCSATNTSKILVYVVAWFLQA